MPVRVTLAPPPLTVTVRVRGSATDPPFARAACTAALICCRSIFTTTMWLVPLYARTTASTGTFTPFTETLAVAVRSEALRPAGSAVAFFRIAVTKFPWLSRFRRCGATIVSPPPFAAGPVDVAASPPAPRPRMAITRTATFNIAVDIFFLLPSGQGPRTV